MLVRTDTSNQSQIKLLAAEIRHIKFMPHCIAYRAADIILWDLGQKDVCIYYVCIYTRWELLTDISFGPPGLSPANTTIVLFSLLKLTLSRSLKIGINNNL